jgi:hypothetical protein
MEVFGPKGVGGVLVNLGVKVYKIRVAPFNIYFALVRLIGLSWVVVRYYKS